MPEVSLICSVVRPEQIRSSCVKPQNRCQRPNSTIARANGEDDGIEGIVPATPLYGDPIKPCPLVGRHGKSRYGVTATSPEAGAGQFPPCVYVPLRDGKDTVELVVDEARTVTGRLVRPQRIKEHLGQPW